MVIVGWAFIFCRGTLLIPLVKVVGFTMVHLLLIPVVEESADITTQIETVDRDYQHAKPDSAVSGEGELANESREPEDADYSEWQEEK